VGDDGSGRVDDSAAGEHEDLSLWELHRIDIRSPVATNAWPVARLELIHPERGRVTDIGKAPGAFDAAFNAAANILRIHPKLLSYTVTSEPPSPNGALPIRVEVEIELGGQRFIGSSAGFDLVRCSLQAWLKAASAFH